jgi:HlyD family secretion protein
MISEASPVAQPATKLSLEALVTREQRRQRRRYLRIALSLLAAVALGCAAYLWQRPKPVPFADRFRSAVVTRGSIVREVSATGRLEALTTVQVGAEISGRIASVDVDFNDRVFKGQLLARLDEAALGAQRAQSKAALTAARASLQRARAEREHTGRSERRALELFATKSGSEAARDDASAAARVAEQLVLAAEAEVAARLAAHQLAETNLTHTSIESPIDGVVITRNVDPGQIVVAALQTPVLFTVAADLRKMQVIAAVDEADIGELARSQEAEFSVHAYPERKFKARVTEVRNAAQVVQDVVTYGVELAVDNFDLALRPGMTASVRIRTQATSDVLRLPLAALSFVPPGEAARTPGVWTLGSGGLRRLAVKAGLSDGELCAVSGPGLSAGTRVLIELTPEGRTAYGLAP